MTDNTGAPRKGRSNAIITYETISAVREGMVRLDMKLDGVLEKVDDNKDTYTKHEVRIQALELSTARAASASDGIAGFKVWLLATLIALPSAITAVVSIIRLVAGS